MADRRPMTPRLRGALDALTGPQRNVLKVLADESEHPWLRGLLRGLVAELVTGEMREVELLHALEGDRLAEVAEAAEGAPPLPEATGEPWFPQGPDGAGRGLE